MPFDHPDEPQPEPDHGRPIPLIRAELYASECACGEMHYDLGGMILDLTILVKMDQRTLEEFIAKITEVWGEVKVEEL